MYAINVQLYSSIPKPISLLTPSSQLYCPYLISDDSSVALGSLVGSIVADGSISKVVNEMAFVLSANNRQSPINESNL